MKSGEKKEIENYIIASYLQERMLICALKISEPVLTTRAETPSLSESWK